MGFSAFSFIASTILSMDQAQSAEWDASTARKEAAQRQKEIEANRPQPGQTPGADIFRRRNAAAALPGGGTFLSGAGGVTDSMLNLGKHTLLGQ